MIKEQNFFLDIFFLLKTLFWKNNLLRNIFFWSMKVVANFNRCLFLLQNLHHYFKKSTIACVYYFDVGLMSRLSKKTWQDIQQKTRHMSRHYWDIYTTYDIEFLRRKKWKEILKRNFFQNFKFFYIKLPNVICCIQCLDMCCLLDVFCCILMSWHMLRHWTVYSCVYQGRFLVWQEYSY